MRVKVTRERERRKQILRSYKLRKQKAIKPCTVRICCKVTATQYDKEMLLHKKYQIGKRKEKNNVG